MIKKNQSLIPFLLPASERSNSTFFDEYKFLTNWETVECDGWGLPATAEAHDWCGLWRTIGCKDTEKHKLLGYGNVVFVKQYQRSCFRAVCKKCYEKWLGRQANRATRRVEKYAKGTGRKPIHVVLSISNWDINLPFKEMKKKARKILKEIGMKGYAMIFHPFRFNKKIRCWYYSPHFHVVGFGWVEGIADSYYKNYWFIKYVGVRKSVFHTFYYLLSHCGIKKGFHALSWAGVLSYSKLKIEDEPKNHRCPICNSKFVELYYAGWDPPIKSDQYFEGILDSDDWCLVQPMSESEMVTPYRFDYASTRDLNETLKGIVIAN